MSRTFTALVGLASLALSLALGGCSSPPSPLVPEPPERPLVVAPRDRDDVDPPAARSDDRTRQSALVVMASEQRSLIGTLENESRFVRTSSGTRDRLREVLFTSDSELSSIERAIAQLDGDDDLPLAERRAQHDELKDRLRRLATRLSLIENAIRER